MVGMPDDVRAAVAQPQLPDRAIYRSASPLAYLAALFVHSWDESEAFWEAKRKGLVIQLAFLGLGAFIWSLVRGWDYAMNEVLLGALITVGPPTGAALLLYLWGVAKAPWQLHARLLSARPKQDESASLLRSKALRLAAEIDQFAAMRHESRPTFGPRFAYGTAAFHDVAEAQRAAAAHSNETAQLYYARFAERVMDTRESFLQLGVFDEEFDRVYLKPTFVDDIATIGQRLLALVDRLPSDFAGPRPRVELKYVPSQYVLIASTPIPRYATKAGTGGLMLRNYGDGIARSVTFSIVFPDIKWAITGAIDQITPDNKFVEPEIRLLYDGAPANPGTVNDPSVLIRRALEESLVAAGFVRKDGDGRSLADQYPEERLQATLNVTYLDVSRRWRFAMPHVLKCAAGDSHPMIELAEGPEPNPISVADGSQQGSVS
jgi:hypothetical protein